MLYIFNKIISNTKSIEYALTVLYGLNKYQSQKICKNFGINPQITINRIKKKHVNNLINYINKKIKVEQFLKIKKTKKIKDLLDIKLIRGLRNNQGLPVRGQRTHTNAKTIKRLKNIKLKKKKKKKKKKINYDFKKKKQKTK